MIYNIFKSIIFLFPPEKAHHLTMSLFKLGLSIPVISQIIKSNFSFESQKLNKNILGLNFPNPVGLAAGFDKDGKYISSISKLGFGFIEVGTVTPKPQIGNPQPRLFRLPKDQALINRMGFNNDGIEALVKNLSSFKKKNPNVIVGGNIGKNKTTPNESAVDDYLICFKALYAHVDYFVVNVSSPNTPNLRALQEKEPLTNLLSSLLKAREAYNNVKPILLKIAPDLNEFQLNDIIEIINELKLDGIIAANTTIDRSDLETPISIIDNIGAGGLSGKPMKDKSTDMIKKIRAASNDDLVIIGVGGIHNGKEAINKLNAGADLIQIYSGLIYEGPGFVKQLKKYIASV